MHFNVRVATDPSKDEELVEAKHIVGKKNKVKIKGEY